MNNKDLDQNIGFEALLDFFPLVELPVLLGETTHLTFSAHNPPLPAILSQKWLNHTDYALDEELTEHIPCFHFNMPDHKIGLVYWEAGLLYYHYHLLIFTKDGRLINDKVIAGLTSRDKLLHRTIAHLEENFIIHTLSASHQENEEIHTENANSQSYQILPDGQIKEI